MQLAREAAMKAVEEKGAQNKENVQQMKEIVRYISVKGAN